MDRRLRSLNDQQISDLLEDHQYDSDPEIQQAIDSDNLDRDLNDGSDEDFVHPVSDYGEDDDGEVIVMPVSNLQVFAGPSTAQGPVYHELQPMLLTAESASTPSVPRRPIEPVNLFAVPSTVQGPVYHDLQPVLPGEVDTAPIIQIIKKNLVLFGYSKIVIMHSNLY